MIRVRKPVVAGQFYPGTARELKNQIAAFLPKTAVKTNAIACMLPHAGYIYSGRVAVETVSQINVLDKIILLGPNHTGYGESFSIMTDGAWETPLGEVKIDCALSKEILKGSMHLKTDSAAHTGEHSLEVELPILQYFKPDFQIVPIAFLSGNLGALREVGLRIAHTIKELRLESSTLIVASSDMTHYECQAEAQKKDFEAIKAILELDEEKLMEKVTALNISMCGYAAVITMLSAAKALGANKGKLVKYQTSGDVTGDTSSVVGYAGVIIY